MTCNTTVRLAEQIVYEEQYLSEAALWMQWQHRGDLVVTNFASLLTVVAEEFQSLVITHPPALASCILYARRYIDAMHSVEWWSITDCVRPETLIADDHDLVFQTAATSTAVGSGLAELAEDKKHGKKSAKSGADRGSMGSLMSG
mmetsp:Transcript_136265/g.248455  ORF Transcript_136265/g.248455 Transcript_136265/m.248455 type:complete len:145 (+) Transcript_136265:3-437(+)